MNWFAEIARSVVAHIGELIFERRLALGAGETAAQINTEIAEFQFRHQLAN